MRNAEQTEGRAGERKEKEDKASFWRSMRQRPSSEAENSSYAAEPDETTEEGTYPYAMLKCDERCLNQLQGEPNGDLESQKRGACVICHQTVLKTSICAGAGAKTIVR